MQIVKFKNMSELFKHGSIYVLAEFVVKALGLLIIPVLAKSLTVMDYGLYFTFLSVSTLASLVMSLGVYGAISRYFYEENADTGRFLFSNFFLLICIVCILSGGAFVGKDYLASVFNLPSKIIYYIIISASSMTILEFLRSYLVAAKLSLNVALISIGKAFLELLLLIGIILNSDVIDIFIPLTSYTVSCLIFSLYSIYILSKHWSVSVRWIHIKYALSFGIPILFHIISSYALNTSDQIIINKMIGPRESGLYALAYRIGMIQQLFTMAMFRSWNPLFFQHMKNDAFHSIEKMAFQLSFPIAVLSMVLISFRSELVLSISTNEFSESIEIIPLIVMGYLFNYLYLTYISYTFYFKKTIDLAVITMVTAFFSVSFNYFLIPLFSYKIAAVTTFFSFFLFFILHYLNIKFRIKPPFFLKLKIVLPNVLVVLIASVFSFLVEKASYSDIVDLIFRLLIFLISLLVMLFIRKKHEKTLNN